MTGQQSRGHFFCQSIRAQLFRVIGYLEIPYPKALATNSNPKYKKSLTLTFLNRVLDSNEKEKDSVGIWGDNDKGSARGEYQNIAVVEVQGKEEN